MTKKTNINTKVKVLKKWEVLDSRTAPEADVFEIALVEDAAGQLAIWRIRRGPPETRPQVQVLSDGQKGLTQENMAQEVESLIGCLEGRGCVCLETAQ